MGNAAIELHHEAELWVFVVQVRPVDSQYGQALVVDEQGIDVGGVW